MEEISNLIDPHTANIFVVALVIAVVLTFLAALYEPGNDTPNWALAAMGGAAWLILISIMVLLGDNLFDVVGKLALLLVVVLVIYWATVFGKWLKSRR